MSGSSSGVQRPTVAIGVDAVGLLDFRLHQLDKIIQLSPDGITPSTDRTFRDVELHVFEHASNLPINRQMIAVFVDQNRRDELRCDLTLVNGADRHFGDDNFVADTFASRFHTLPNKANHLADHRNEIEHLGDFNAHQLERFATFTATTFVRGQIDMHVPTRNLRRVRSRTGGLAHAHFVRFAT
jgi:hypothetical protein